MQAVAHNPAFAKKVGVPTKVGKEFTKSGGGMATNKAAKMNQMKKTASAAVAKKPAAPGAVPAYARPMMDKKAGTVKKAGMGMMGGRPAGAGPRPATPPPTQTAARQAQMNQMAGTVKKAGLGSQSPTNALKPYTEESRKANMAGARPAGGMGMMGARLGAAARSGMPMKKMASGGLAAGHKSADGIASKGKTKAKQISMAGSKGMKYGGKC